MKNVIESDIPRSFSNLKSSFVRFFELLIPSSLVVLVLSLGFLTGCFFDKPQQPIYVETSNTAASVYSENDFGGDELPFGVKLQVNPSVLIPVELERVVDGDTIIIHDANGKQVRVRLTGIDAPESVHEDESKNTNEGREASKFLQELLANVDTVYLEMDVEEKDQYDRTLAYVWIDTGSTYIMVNEIMLQQATQNRFISNPTSNMQTTSENTRVDL